MPLLGTVRARDCFLKILNEVRDDCDFGLFGFVVMPEHIHLLISETNIGNPSDAMAVLKQRVSRALSAQQIRSPHGHFWQRRFYDFNVWSARKKNEKMNYIHFNPVKRGLVEKPGDWIWSSYSFYWSGKKGVCTPNPTWESKTWRRKGKPAPVANGATSAAPTSHETRLSRDPV
jgi:putative transposase